MPAAEPGPLGVIGLVRGGVATAMDLVLPRPCPGCGGPGPWCAGCDATLRGRPRRVSLPESVTTRAGSGRGGSPHGITGIPPIWAIARYRDPVRSAILSGKERGRRDLPGHLGLALGHGLLRLHRFASLPEPIWLVPAPSRRAAARSRGGDPVTAMARAAAELVAANGYPTGVAPCLVTAGSARDSVGLDAAGRAANLADRIRWRASGAPPPGAGVIVIDDVVTTGATTLAACRALRDAGVDVTGVLALAAVPPWITTR